MKFVACRADNAVAQQFRLNVTDRLQFVSHCRRTVKHSAHLKTFAAEVNQVAHKIHKAAAFRENWQAVFRRVKNRRADFFIAFKPSREHFGETAADYQAVNLWQSFIVKRAEVHNFRAKSFKLTKTRAVIEIERRITRNTDFDGRRKFFGTCEIFKRCRIFRKLNQRVNVNLIFNSRADFFQHVRSLMFTCRHQTQMAFGQAEFVIAFECAETFNALHVQGVDNHLLMRIGAEPI